MICPECEHRPSARLNNEFDKVGHDAADAGPALLAACKGMLPMLEHLERCEASADDGFGEKLRALRRSLTAARAAILAAEPK